MKLYNYLLIILIALLLSSCDSPTDSKATSFAAPVLISPSNNDTLTTFIPTFKWSGIADKFQIAEDQSFTHLIYSVNLSDSLYALPGNVLTEHNKLYYWHAGKTTGNTTYWSELTFGFVTPR